MLGGGPKCQVKIFGDFLLGMVRFYSEGVELVILVADFMFNLKNTVLTL